MTRKFPGAGNDDPDPSGIAIWLKREEFCGLMATYRTDRPDRFSDVVDHDIVLKPPSPGGVTVPFGATVAPAQPVEKMSVKA